MLLDDSCQIQRKVEVTVEEVQDGLEIEKEKIIRRRVVESRDIIQPPSELQQNRRRTSI